MGLVEVRLTLPVRPCSAIRRAADWPLKEGFATSRYRNLGKEERASPQPDGGRKEKPSASVAIGDPDACHEDSKGEKNRYRDESA